MEIGEQEEKAQDTLLKLMKKHGLKEYRLDDDYMALIETQGERAFVRRVKKGRPKGKKAEKEKADAE
jgi:hypothetical protein